MLGIILKKSVIRSLRMLSMTSQLSRFKVPGLLVFGFFVGVAVNQLGFVMEDIHLHVELVKSSNITDSSHSTFKELMQRLPHLDQPFSASKYVVPNIVHFFWSVLFCLIFACSLIHSHFRLIVLQRC